MNIITVRNMIINNFLGTNEMNIMILEDNQTQLDGLRQLLAHRYSDSEIYCYSEFSSAQNAVSTIIFDLFILDIHISDDSPDGDGVAIGHYIRQISHYKRTPILFLTSITDRISSCLNDLHCYSYITKPYSENDLYRAIDSLRDLTPDTVSVHNQYISVKSTNCIYIRILCSDILYIEGSSHYLTIYCKNKIVPTSEYCLSTITNVLSEDFFRCHKKYIINVNFIENYDKANRYVRIEQTTIPVGRSYKSELEALLQSI